MTSKNPTSFSGGSVKKYYIKFGYKEDGELIVSDLCRRMPVAQLHYLNSQGSYKEVRDVKIIELNKENLESLVEKEKQR